MIELIIQAVNFWGWVNIFNFIVIWLLVIIATIGWLFYCDVKKKLRTFSNTITDKKDELKLEGLIEYKGEDEFQLTDKGIDRVMEVWKRLDDKGKVLMLCLFTLTMEAVNEG